MPPSPSQFAGGGGGGEGGGEGGGWYAYIVADVSNVAQLECIPKNDKGGSSVPHASIHAMMAKRASSKDICILSSISVLHGSQ